MDEMSKAKEDFSPELQQFEDFVRRAIELGFTIHLNHQRYHPAHMAWAPTCQSRVELVLVPILEHPREQFGQNRTIIGDSILAVLEEGQRLIDRYAAGERLAEPVAQRRRGNISQEERERRRQRMLDYWSRKRGEEAAETIEPAASIDTPGESVDA